MVARTTLLNLEDEQGEALRKRAITMSGGGGKEVTRREPSRALKGQRCREEECRRPFEKPFLGKDLALTQLRNNKKPREIPISTRERRISSMPMKDKLAEG